MWSQTKCLLLAVRKNQKRLYCTTSCAKGYLSSGC